MLTTNQMTFWNVGRSPRPIRLIHIRIMAIGCKRIESNISKSSFMGCSSRLHRFARLRSL